MKLHILLLLLVIGNWSHAQKLYPLEHSIGAPVYFNWGDVQLYNDGYINKMTSPFELSVKGGGGSVNVDSLILFNADFTSTFINLHLSKCVDPNGYAAVEAGSYFVSIGFFDADSNFVFGHSMTCDEGFSLAGSHTDLQATKLEVKNIGEKVVEETCYTLIGKDRLAIHQAFMYKHGEPAGGIKPIEFVSIEIFSMGAG